MDHQGSPTKPILNIKTEMGWMEKDGKIKHENYYSKEIWTSYIISDKVDSEQEILWRIKKIIPQR